MKSEYTIGIVTYVERFEKWFKPLLRAIKDHRHDVEVIVCINGEHKKKFDEEYRVEMLNFLAEYPNVYPMFFTSHRSLSKLWNCLLINSTNDMVLRMDDDITIANNNFWTQIENAITAQHYRSFKINGSWSHTLLNRLEVEEAGWFDERFLGGGEEDGDFEWRYGNTFGREFANVGGFSLINHWAQVDYDKCLVNMKKCDGKRSTFNKEFVQQKYALDDGGESHGIIFDGRKIKCVDPTQNQYPYEKFFWKHRNDL